MPTTNQALVFGFLILFSIGLIFIMGLSGLILDFGLWFLVYLGSIYAKKVPIQKANIEQTQQTQKEDNREEQDKIEFPEEPNYPDSSDSDLIEWELDEDET